ncbi:alpha-L-fucosidase [bacterium]|nr:alpha-L-fucosidase [bacterium]
MKRTAGTVFPAFVILLGSLCAAGWAVAREPGRLDWFEDAKLGIFIHWGIYAVDGTVESWPIHSGEIPYEKYMSQRKGFTASAYDPNAWAKLFKEAGARYAVLTSKHHDGMALWDTKQGKLSMKKATPAKRDLIGPYCEALRAEGLRVGLYFSHLDWSHPDYATLRPEKATGELNKWDYADKGKEDPQAWQRFLKFHKAQILEIAEQFNPDLWWFDGDWTRNAEEWDMKTVRAVLEKHNPEAVFNSRMAGLGDYATPEQGIPSSRIEGPWEFCMTINDSWGWRPGDTNFKSARQIIRIFADCLGGGGNLLLDIGPKADGTIDEAYTSRLKALGRWVAKHQEAVYGTRVGLPAGHFYGGPTSLSRDSATVYLYCYDIPRDQVQVKGIRNTIQAVRVVGEGSSLTFRKMGGAAWINVPGILFIDVPECVNDPDLTVIAVDLEGKLDLYTGKGRD